MSATALPTATESTAAAQAVVDRRMLIQAIELQHRGEMDQAEHLFQHFLQHHPDDPVALYSLAVVLLQRVDNGEAIQLLDSAVQRVQGFAPLWFAHATAIQRQGRREEALQSFQRAIDLQPDYTTALNNSGVLLREMHQHAAALQRFEQVLQFKPDDQMALSNGATLLTEFRRSPEAIGLLERLVALNPHYDYAPGMLSYERLHLCDWRGFETLTAEIRKGVRAGQRTCKSLPLMAISDSAQEHQQCARLFSTQRYRKSSTALWQGERYRHDRIRLAYVSPDLREHPVGHLMAGIFEQHDRQRFELIAVSLGPNDGSSLRERMVRSFDHFIDAREWTSPQIAARLREMEVDIAVDLAGYTADSRNEVFGMRPAPVQVNYLGYPGTLGNDYMDYILADRHVIPPDQVRFYDEAVVYLPDAYLPPASGLQVSERTPTRAECGLPDSGVVFCSFNHDYKILPPLFAVWMRLLSQVPDSVLWLMARNETTQQNLRNSAAAQGINPDRLVFAQRVPRVEDHLARYRLADIFLDTYPYNAHSTAADALLSGLPVVTCSGKAFPSRVAGSLLHAVGLPELVTESFDAYESLALALALHPAQRARLRQRLAVRPEGHPFFDPRSFCRQLEAAFTTMWRQAQLGDARDALSGAS
jgi:protein O-GlcNAc transferase